MAGVTLPELLVGLGVGCLLLTAAAALSVYGAHTFAAIGSFTGQNAKGRHALDVLSWKLRGAGAVLACQTNLPVKSLTVANPDAAHTITLTWDSQSRRFELDETGQSPRTLLTDCDAWEFTLYSRAPAGGLTNLAFNLAATLSECRLVNMSWRRSEPVPGEKMNATSVETAQVWLRNAR